MIYLDSLRAWLAANPTLFLVILYLMTAVINAVFEYVKVHENESKFLRGLDKFFSVCGLDAGVVVDFLRKVLGAPPSPPMGGGKGLFSNPPPYFPGSNPPPATKKISTGVVVVAKGKKIWQGTDAVVWLLTLVVSLASFGATGVLLSGCGLLHSAVPALDKVVTYVTDFELVLKAVEDLATVFFLASPNPNEQAQFATLDRRAHEACDAVVRLADAGKDLDSDDMVVALSDMQAAYRDLEAFLGKAGIPVPHPPAAGYLGGTPAPYQPPLVMQLHLRTK